MVFSYAPATLPHGIALGATPPPGWAQLAPVGFGRFGALPPPPPPPPGGQPVPKVCPRPGTSSEADKPSTPIPPVRWIRYQDPGLQETYARIYGALREPAVLGVKVVPEEQADMMARQILDAIIALPQSAELRFRAGCAVKSLVLGPIGITAIVVAALGLTGAGVWAYKRRQRRLG
jgi:hypothetical protein